LFRVFKRTWKQFLQSHWETLYACDFFGVEVLGVVGTVRHMVFFVIDVKSRAVEIAGVRIAPDGDWMKQITRRLLDPTDGFLRHASHLIHDRDPVFTEAWTALLATGGVKCVPIPAQSPNCNPHAERFVKTIRTECLEHFVIFGERHLQHLLKEFTGHYLTERHHQGIGSQIIRPKLPKPGEDRLWAHDLAAGPALLGGQRLTPHGQAAPLLRAEIDPGLAGRRRKSLLQNPNFLLQVVDPSRHPLVDRVRYRRDDELERYRQHRIGPRLPAHRGIFKPAVWREIMRESAATNFWTSREDPLVDSPRNRVENEFLDSTGSDDQMLLSEPEFKASA
jgi:integrase-like protein